MQHKSPFHFSLFLNHFEIWLCLLSCEPSAVMSWHRVEHNVWAVCLETRWSEFKQSVTFISSLHTVARRQIRGLALLNSHDNNCAFCIHEKSPIIYWFGLALCLGDLRLSLIPITRNTVPLSRETISHLSVLLEKWGSICLDRRNSWLCGEKALCLPPPVCPLLVLALPSVSPPYDL